MEAKDNYSELKKEKQKQILKLVTKSFYKELISYGVDASDIVTVSVNLLDYVTDKNEASDNQNLYYNNLFQIQSVTNLWGSKKQLSLGQVSISPLTRQHIPYLQSWLKESDITQTYIRFFPQEKIRLESYLMDRPDRKYFAIYLNEEEFVGIIGAERINEEFKKLEMKKFIGSVQHQGKGIGKAATFLFLYYAFTILQFNKVYLYSLDTNIKNINLNSKFGFELEGILYEEAQIGGIFMDVLRMGLLKNDWKRIFYKMDEDE